VNKNIYFWFFATVLCLSQPLAKIPYEISVFCDKQGAILDK